MTADEPQKSSTLRIALDQLVELQRVDTERDKALRARAHLDTGAAAEREMQAAAAAAGAAAQKLHASEGALKDAELQQQGVEQKRATYEQQMRTGRVTNPREISNIEREINQLTRQRSSLDDKILHLMEQTEADRTAMREAEERSREAQQRYATQRDLYRSGLARLDAELQRLEGERLAAAAAVSDRALLQRYESLRARPSSSGVAVARTVDRHCTACHMQVSSQDVERVAEGSQIVTCQNCGRLLA